MRRGFFTRRGISTRRNVAFTRVETWHFHEKKCGIYTWRGRGHGKNPRDKPRKDDIKQPAAAVKQKPIVSRSYKYIKQSYSHTYVDSLTSQHQGTYWKRGKTDFTFPEWRLLIKSQGDATFCQLRPGVELFGCILADTPCQLSFSD